MHPDDDNALTVEELEAQRAHMRELLAQEAAFFYVPPRLNEYAQEHEEEEKYKG